VRLLELHARCLALFLGVALFLFSENAEAKIFTRSVVLPSGEKGYSVNCDNMPMTACYERAGDICHRGYEVVTTATEQGFIAEGRAFESSGQYGSSGSASTAARSTSDKGLLIQCKESELTEKERAEWLALEAEKQAIKENASRARLEALERSERKKTLWLILGAVGGTIALALIVTATE
jgi:hypothetical protein